MKKPLLAPRQVRKIVEQMIGDGLHSKQTESVANATVGALHSDRAGVAAVGRAMARQRGVKSKHAIKQVDRLLSNDKILVEDVNEDWVPWVIGARKEIVVTSDWTEFARDEQVTCAISMVTRHGCATPLVWLTVDSKRLKNNRSRFETQALLRLANAMPAGVRVTVLGDRAFGDTDLYDMLDALRFDYVIRFRGCIHVTSSTGETRAASEWVPERRGRYAHLRDAQVTHEKFRVGAVVIVHDREMKEPWHLVTSRNDAAAAIAKLYGRRFTCEESFRDLKDCRYGLGLLETRIGDVARRDRFLLVMAMTTVIATLVGAAGEQLGLDKMLRANTSKKRTHSLFRQGREYLQGLPPPAADQLARELVTRIRNHPDVPETFAEI